MNGSDPRSLIRAIRGPITLITLGALFALNNFTRYQFEQTWPVLLIVFGLLSLLRRSVEPARTETMPPPPPPPFTYPGPPPSSGGGYRQSTYTGTTPDTGSTPGSTKGGFGSSASSRSNDPAQPGGPS